MLTALCQSTPRSDFPARHDGRYTALRRSDPLGEPIVGRLCYDSSMKKRPGGTTHLSISLPTAEAKLLRRRAKRVYDGNVSRGKGKPTQAEAAQLDNAWGFVAKAPPESRGAVKKSA